MVTFDLRTKIIRQNQQAWVVHAGRAQKYFTSFQDRGKIFLDVPRLYLPPEALRSKASVRRAIRRAIALDKYYSNEVVDRPSDALSDYSGSVFADGNLTKLTGSVSTLFNDVKPGDLIVTPGFHKAGEYRYPVILFGEVERGFSEGDFFEDGERVPYETSYRHVKWINSVSRRELPIELDRRIGKPPAIRSFPIDESTQGILKLAYDNFIYEDSSTSVVKAPRYDAQKFIILNEANWLISVLVAAHEAYLISEINVDEIKDLEGFTKEWFSKSDVENIEIDFASPGFWRVIGATATLGAFLSVGIAALTDDEVAAELKKGIKVENSLSATADEEALVEKSINLFLESIAEKDLVALKKKAKEAKDEIGLQSPAKKKSK